MNKTLRNWVEDMSYLCQPRRVYWCDGSQQHWLNVGAKANPDKLPRIFYENWFRKNKDGKWLWSGYGENSRVFSNGSLNGFRERERPKRQ